MNPGLSRRTAHAAAGAAGSHASTLTAGLRLQRKCACGTKSEGEQCEECRRGKLQKHARHGAQDDIFERNADRVADEVLRGPQPRGPRNVQPVPHSGGEREVPASVAATLRDTGQPLEPALRNDMENRFGHDFSRVRIHTGGSAQRSADEVGAEAYTVGRDVAFAAGRFAPGTHQGRKLLAHELTHVVQQGAGASALQRQPDKKPEKKPDQPPKPKETAADAAKLKVTPSKNGKPCACVLVIHNDEQSARRTAGLMHANCSYNLALLEPDDTAREMRIPGQRGTKDPNSLFPRNIVEKCLDDQQGCRDFVAKNSSSTKPAEIEQVVQTQFFLAVDECSAQFSLPVIALHNNALEDTKNYRKDKDAKGTGDLKLDVDKSAKATGEDQLTKLKGLLTKKFGEDVFKELNKAKQTNIFRWCFADDLSRCHIGDPDRPDTVTWVTRQSDFDTLSKKNVNVVLQSEVPKKGDKPSESEGDLSTMFLLMRIILEERLPQAVAALQAREKTDWITIDLLLDDLQKIFAFGDQTMPNVMERIREILLLWMDTMWVRGEIAVAPARTRTRISRLQFVNIETPGKGKLRPAAEQVSNYESIVEILSALGLHCCGTDPKKAEASIKEGLKK